MLAGGVVWLWSKSSENVVKSSPVAGELKKGQTILNSVNAKPEVVDNEAGVVESWDGGKNVLVIKVDGKTVSFNIPASARVLIGKSQNKQLDTKLYLVDKSQQMQWSSAFCVGDLVTLLLDINTAEVREALDPGYRMCGFRD